MIDMITNWRYVPPLWRPEVLEAYERAVKAGAPDDLEFIGMGMFGVVFCDEEDEAWKVYRLGSEFTAKKTSRKSWRPGPTPEHLLFLRAQLTDEYEWLRDAAATPMADHVAKVYDIDLKHLVLHRECVRGEPGNSWHHGKELHALYKEINRAMEEIGWTAPEYKDDSFILRAPDGPFVLVDASMPHRLGERLADFVEDVLAGRRETDDSWHSLAFYLLRERPYKTILEPRLKALVAELVERDPSIAQSFII